MTFRTPPQVDEQPAVAAAAIAAEIPHEWPRVGYMARALVQTTIPHRASTATCFQRTNGALTLTLNADARYGLPYGKYPRLLLAWITRRALLSRSPCLSLPMSQRALLSEFGIQATGRSLRALREQAIRLTKCTLTLDYAHDRVALDAGYRIARNTALWWDAGASGRMGSIIELNQDFYAAVTAAPVPFAMEVVCALRSPLAIDLYIWATYRVHGLAAPLSLPWVALQAQFGASYRRQRNFRPAFGRALANVRGHWPRLRATVGPAGLLLRPCAPHVAPRAIWFRASPRSTTP